VQEEVLVAALSSKEQRMAPGLTKRANLLRECSESIAVSALLDELVAQISAGLATYQVRCFHTMAMVRPSGRLLGWGGVGLKVAGARLVSAVK
jgi:hypothetical protein